MILIRQLMEPMMRLKKEFSDLRLSFGPLTFTGAARLCIAPLMIWHS